MHLAQCSPVFFVLFQVEYAVWIQLHKIVTPLVELAPVVVVVYIVEMLNSVACTTGRKIFDTTHGSHGYGQGTTTRPVPVQP